jgi:hypothetical protein
MKEEKAGDCGVDGGRVLVDVKNVKKIHTHKKGKQ